MRTRIIVGFGLEKLFLFDIDGTLMRGAGPRHGAALVEAVRRVLEVETTLDGIPVHGMLDRDIVQDILLRAGRQRQEIEAHLPTIFAAAQEIYAADTDDLRSKVLPGVHEVLQAITAEGHGLGLVTGNLSGIGWKKVEYAGLRHYFRFGAFADMGATRADLARMAVELSGLSGCAVTMVGDAPSDVEAAKRNGFRIVAVATGLTPREDLESLKPDLVLDDLSTPEARAALMGLAGAANPLR